MMTVLAAGSLEEQQAETAMVVVATTCPGEKAHAKLRRLLLPSEESDIVQADNGKLVKCALSQVVLSAMWATKLQAEATRWQARSTKQMEDKEMQGSAELEDTASHILRLLHWGADRRRSMQLHTRDLEEGRRSQEVDDSMKHWEVECWEEAPNNAAEVRTMEEEELRGAKPFLEQRRWSQDGAEAHRSCPRPSPDLWCREEEPWLQWLQGICEKESE